MSERDLQRLTDAAARAAAPPPVAAIRRRARRRRAARVTAAGGGVVAAVIAVTLAVLPQAPTPQPPPLASWSVAPPVVAPTSPPAAGSPSATGSARATRSPADTGSPPTSSPPPADSSVPCRTATGLRVTTSPHGGGSTHRGLTLVFTNAGVRPCRMTGYPGVAALDGSGAQIAQAKRTPRGYLGGAGEVRTITIPANGKAEATAEALAFNPDGGACTAFAALLVTPPDDTAPTRVPWDTDACADLEVHPVA
ncbi:DUF4232 domain-containing protein [Dactylosporangium vinaceum]|uniref:DUF4232 domain-containing protein n=1 Tax=Dactylosporangium vinaceum TaxID=53362 RepID=A0ABV5MKU8_9ACTN|nr:DUF4232 domain-containing protein [Dactylosporangium vinaceum]UAB93950.1 DUF4232 domain-containing protein [Dactylosporangium vinaceum]